MSKKQQSPHAARSRARKRALQALYQWEMTEQSASEILEQFIQEQDMSKVDVDYLTLLVETIIDQHQVLDDQIAKFSDRALDLLDPLEISVIRLAALELKQCLEVPFKVVLDEAVGLARDFGSEQSPLFVNGVLDRCANHWREPEYKAATG